MTIQLFESMISQSSR